ncbi:MAG: hypothetical protein KDD89_08185, partial [Anaerolineales bacterium]|nr:hypothetical protein [Anaerolineales bacterium]
LDMGPLSKFGRPVIKATSTVTATAVTLDDNGTATPTGNGDPNPNNNEHEEFIGIDAGYDLEVNLESAANPQPFQEPFTLTAKLLNVGAETARAITFTVGIPISLTYNSHTSSDLACTYATGTRLLTCTAPEQDPLARGGDELAVRLNLTAVQSGTIGLPLEASAAAGYSDYLSQDTGNGEKDPDNNSGLFTIQVENDAKLSLTAFQLPADGRVGTGDNITYTVRLKNDGPNKAENISLTMIWTPVGENPVPTSYPSFCNPVGTNVLECTPPNLARGESSPTYQFVARAPATIANTPVGAQLNMLATSAASQKAANAKLFTKILRKAQLEITLSDSADPAPTSQPYTITVNVHNLSTHPSTVTTATLTAVGYNFDAATLRSKPDFCTVTNGFQMVCALGTLGDNQIKEFGLGLNAPTESGSRTILGRVSSSTLMPLKATASEQTTFRPERRVSVSMTAVPSSTVKPNERLTLNVRLENSSNDPATKLELTFRGNYPLQNVALPSGVTCAPTTVNIAPLLPAFKCNLPDLAGNTTAVYSFQLTVPRGKDSLTHFANLEIFEINRASNSDVRVSFIEKEVDLAITKLTDTPDPVGKGDVIQYAAKIHNNSAITATNVTATFAVPDATIFSATSAVTCNISSNGHLATCTFATLPPYTSQELAFRATVPTNTTKDNIAAGLDVQGTERDPVTGNNGKVVDTAVEEQHDLNFTTAQVSGAPAPSGKIVFVDLSVRNTANGTAENVLVKPTLTPNLQLVKLWHFTGAANSTECPQTGCQLGNIAQNESKTLRVVVRVIGTVNDGDTATVTLSATAENSGEKNPTDNNQTTTFDLTNKADMSATITTADGQPLVAGKNGTLRLTLNNLGPAEAKNVVATITLPQDITAVSSGNASCATFAHSVVCPFSTFQKGEEWVDV